MPFWQDHETLTQLWLLIDALQAPAHSWYRPNAFIYLFCFLKKWLTVWGDMLFAFLQKVRGEDQGQPRNSLSHYLQILFNKCWFDASSYVFINPFSDMSSGKCSDNRVTSDSFKITGKSLEHSGFWWRDAGGRTWSVNSEVTGFCWQNIKSSHQKLVVFPSWHHFYFYGSTFSSRDICFLCILYRFGLACPLACSQSSRTTSCCILTRTRSLCLAVFLSFSIFSIKEP